MAFTLGTGEEKKNGLPFTKGAEKTKKLFSGQCTFGMGRVKGKV